MKSPVYTTYFQEPMRLHNVDFLKKFQKAWALNKKCIAEKDDFGILN